jgi:hypothetical protein
MAMRRHVARQANPVRAHRAPIERAPARWVAVGRCASRTSRGTLDASVDRMRNLPLFVLCSAGLACVGAPPDDPAPPDARQEDVAARQDDPEAAPGCLPAEASDAATDDAAMSSAPRAEGEDDTHWYTPILPIGWVLDHLFGHKHKMDPEPDRRKDQKHCDDWCEWEQRQCRKECDHRIPRTRWYERIKCYNDCKTAADICRSDCQKKFSERPITAVSP